MGIGGGGSLICGGRDGSGGGTVAFPVEEEVSDPERAYGHCAASIKQRCERSLAHLYTRAQFYTRNPVRGSSMGLPVAP